MKQIAFYSYVPKLHSLYKELINQPPKGYTYLVNKSQIEGRFNKVLSNKTLKDFILFGVNRYVDTSEIKAHIWRFKKFPQHDLLYSTGFLSYRKEPWVVDMEFPSGLTSYNLKRYIRRRDAIARLLSKPYCKRIIPWTEAAAEVMRKSIPEVKEKVLAVPLAVTQKKRVRKERKDDKTRFLFLGSSNLPRDFAIKGGPETLEAFKQLSAKRDDVELIFRCYVPPELKKKYQDVKGLRIIDSVLPWKELENLYLTSDVFVGPAHHTPGVAHLEAMSYGLPIIATDVFENARIVSPDVGTLIPKHHRAQYFGKWGMPIWGFPKFMRELEREDFQRTAMLCEVMRSFADNKNKRKIMGKAALRRTRTGPYSIAGRNKLLKSVYDAATR